MIRRVPINPGDLTDHEIGTKDILTGTTDTPLLYGDAGGNLSGHAKAGNDGITLSLGDGHFTDTVYGDAGGNLSGFAEGGNDTLTASNGPERTLRFYGDAGANMSDYAHGGNDSFTKN